MQLRTLGCRWCRALLPKKLFGRKQYSFSINELLHCRLLNQQNNMECHFPLCSSCLFHHANFFCHDAFRRDRQFAARRQFAGHLEKRSLLSDHIAVLYSFPGYLAAPLRLFGRLLSKRFVSTLGLPFHPSTFATRSHACQKVDRSHTCQKVEGTSLAVEDFVCRLALGCLLSLLLHATPPIND